MSKELIEKLRAAAEYRNNPVGDLFKEAADALEAKAAPVGEREAFEAWAASVGYHTERDMFQREKYQSSLTWELWRVWQAGAAHHRQQAREVASDAAREVLAAVNLELRDLFPSDGKRTARKGPSRAAVEFERQVVTIGRAMLARGDSLPPADLERLELAHQRLASVEGMA